MQQDSEPGHPVCRFCAHVPSVEHWVELRSSIACAGFVSSNPLLGRRSLLEEFPCPSSRWPTKSDAGA